MASILPAPRPTSAMAEVTSPTMMSGIRKLSNCAKTLLNVLKMRTPMSGITKPRAMPSTMAMRMRRRRGSRDILFGELMGLAGGNYFILHLSSS